MIGPENHLVETVVQAAIQFVSGGLPVGATVAPWLNPLVIVGPPGSGKSHLASGLASIVADATGPGQVLVTTAADFAAQYAAAVADDSLEAMRERIRRAQMWVVEDLAQFPERKGFQLEFLNRLEENIGAGVWTVVTASRMPAQLTNMLSAVRSRLEGGFTLPLVSPSLAVRREFVRRHALAHDVSLEPHEIDGMARQLPATVRQLLGAIQRTKLSRLAGSADPAQKSAERDSPKEVVSRRLPIEEVLAVTARYFGFSQAALKSAVRTRSTVHARSVAMYLARELAGCTLQEIGQALGGRDHTTVLHACRKIDQTALQQAALQEELADLRRLLLTT